MLMLQEELQQAKYLNLSPLFSVGKNAINIGYNPILLSMIKKLSHYNLVKNMM